jgi:hypothetical protein
LIEEGCYFEAHEILEALWFPRRFDDSNEIRLLRGLINGAVAMELLHRGRHLAACKVWQNYLKYRPLTKALDNPDRRSVFQQMASALDARHRELLYD